MLQQSQTKYQTSPVKRRATSSASENLTEDGWSSELKRRKSTPKYSMLTDLKKGKHFSLQLSRILSAGFEHGVVSTVRTSDDSALEVRLRGFNNKFILDFRQIDALALRTTQNQRKLLDTYIGLINVYENVKNRHEHTVFPNVIIHIVYSLVFGCSFLLRENSSKAKSLITCQNHKVMVAHWNNAVQLSKMCAIPGFQHYNYIGGTWLKGGDKFTAHSALEYIKKHGDVISVQNIAKNDFEHLQRICEQLVQFEKGTMWALVKFSRDVLMTQAPALYTLLHLVLLLPIIQSAHETIKSYLYERIYIWSLVFTNPDSVDGDQINSALQEELVAFENNEFMKDQITLFPFLQTTQNRHHDKILFEITIEWIKEVMFDYKEFQFEVDFKVLMGSLYNFLTANHRIHILQTGSKLAKAVWDELRQFRDTEVVLFDSKDGKSQVGCHFEANVSALLYSAICDTSDSNRVLTVPILDEENGLRSKHDEGRYTYTLVDDDLLSEIGKESRYQSELSGQSDSRNALQSATTNSDRVGDTSLQIDVSSTVQSENSEHVNDGVSDTTTGPTSDSQIGADTTELQTVVTVNISDADNETALTNHTALENKTYVPQLSEQQQRTDRLRVLNADGDNISIMNAADMQSKVAIPDDDAVSTIPSIISEKIIEPIKKTIKFRVHSLQNEHQIQTKPNTSEADVSSFDPIVQERDTNDIAIPPSSVTGGNAPLTVHSHDVEGGEQDSLPPNRWPDDSDLGSLNESTSAENNVQVKTNPKLNVSTEEHKETMANVRLLLLQESEKYMHLNKDLQERVDTLSEHNHILDAKLKDTESKRLCLESKVKGLQEQIRDFRNSITDYDYELIQSKATISNERSKSVQETHRRKAIEKTLAEFTADFTEKNNIISDLTSECLNLKQLHSDLELKIVQLQELKDKDTEQHLISVAELEENTQAVLRDNMKLKELLSKHETNQKLYPSQNNLVVEQMRKNYVSMENEMECLRRKLCEESERSKGLQEEKLHAVTELAEVLNGNANLQSKLIESEQQAHAMKELGKLKESLSSELDNRNEIVQNVHEQKMLLEKRTQEQSLEISKLTSEANVLKTQRDQMKSAMEDLRSNMFNMKQQCYDQDRYGDALKLENKMYCDRLDHINVQVKELLGDLSDMTEKFTYLKAENERQALQLEKVSLRDSCRSTPIQNPAHKLEQNIMELSDELRRKNLVIEQLQSNLSKQKDFISQMETDSASGNDLNVNLKRDFEKLLTSNKQLQEKIRNTSVSVQNGKGSHHSKKVHKATQSTVVTDDLEMHRAIDQLSSLTEKSDRLQLQNKSVLQERDQLWRQYENARSTLLKLLDDNGALKSQELELSQRVKDTSKLLEFKTNEIARLKDLLDQMKETNTKLDDKLSWSKNNCSLLREKVNFVERENRDCNLQYQLLKSKQIPPSSSAKSTVQGTGSSVWDKLNIPVTSIQSSQKKTCSNLPVFHSVLRRKMNRQSGVITSTELQNVQLNSNNDVSFEYLMGIFRKLLDSKLDPLGLADRAQTCGMNGAATVLYPCILPHKTNQLTRTILFTILLLAKATGVKFVDCLEGQLPLCFATSDTVENIRLDSLCSKFVIFTRATDNVNDLTDTVERILVDNYTHNTSPIYF